MSEPGQEGQQPPSEIWSRWRERRAARRASSGAPQPFEPTEPAPPAVPPSEPPLTAVEPDAQSANGGESAYSFSGIEDPPPGPDDAPPDPTAEPHVHDHECLDWCPICRTADVVRASVPPELRDQWADVQREALATLRAMIDHYLARAEE